MNAGSVKADFRREGTMDLSADRHGRLLLRSPYSFKEQAKAIPYGRWEREMKVWRYPPKVEVLQALRPYLVKNEIVPDAEARKVLILLGRQEREHQEGVAKATEIKRADSVKIDVPLKTKLRPYQKKAAAVGLSLRESAFLMEQGTGKTLAAIAVAGQRYLRGEVKRVLVVAPVSVLPVWQLEFEKHAKFPHVVMMLSAKKLRSGTVRSWVPDTSALQVAVINYEALWRVEDAIAKWDPDLVILDESQKIKNGQAKQSKACHRIGDRARFRMILTGTPVTQRPLDIWSQYRFLNSSIFGQWFTKFRDRYAIMGGYQGYEVVGYRDLDDLARRAHSIAFRVTKEEAKLDLPPVTDQTLYVELKDETRKVYKEFDKKMVAMVGGERVSAPNVLTELLRLQQITGGFIGTGSEGVEGKVLPVGTEKLDALEEFIEDFPKERQLVIFARFVPELEAIAARLKKRGESLDVLAGSTPKEKRGRIVAAFQEGTIRILLIQTQTGSLGITLTAAATAVLYSLTFSSADYEQLRARIHRMGQKLPVTYVHLVARGTVDEDILQALQEKRDLAQLVVDKFNPIRKDEGDHMKKKREVFRIDEAKGSDKAGADPVAQAVEELERETSASTKNSTGDEEMAKKDKKVKDKKAKAAAAETAKPKKANGADGDVVTLAEICEEKKVSGIALRKALRSSKIKKPGESWRWPKGHADLKEVRKLADGLKG